jgi:hypothetical protein
VSQVTISQSLYLQSRGALRSELAKCLRTARALRHPSRKLASVRTGSGTWCQAHYCPVSRFRRARCTSRNVMTVARTNNGSNMKTNKEFESTITTSSSV